MAITDDDVQSLLSMMADLQSIITLLKNGNLDALADLNTAADKLPYFTGSGSAALATLTGAARTLLSKGSAGDMRSALGMGTSDVPTFRGLVVQDNNFTSITISSTAAGVDPILLLEAPGGSWRLHNDDSSGNTLDFRYDNVSKAVMTKDGALTVLTVDTTGEALAKVHTGNSDGETDFPIGHTVLANGNVSSRNSNCDIRLSASFGQYDIGSGTPLTGTYRARGRFTTSTGLVERVL